MRLLLALFLCLGVLASTPEVSAQANADPLLAPGVQCDEFVPPTLEREIVRRPAAPPARRLGSFALLALSLVLAFLSIDKHARPASATRRRYLRRLLALAILASLAAAVMPALPVHEHNSFVARVDCAIDPACDSERPGWMPPTYHAEGLILGPWPRRYPLAFAAGFALTLLAWLLFADSLRRIRRLSGASGGERVALLTFAFASLHPVAARLSVAGTFWPWADVCLFGAAWLATWAVEHRSLSAWVSAAGFFAFALSSSVTFLGLLPLVWVVPWAWSRRPPTPRSLLPLALLGVFVGPYAWLTLRQMGGAAAAMPWSQKLASVIPNLIYLDPRLTPLPLGLLFILGLVVVLRRPRRNAPLLAAFVLTEALLGSIQSFDSGYPVRLIHGTTSLYFSAWLAAEGAWWLVDGLRRWRAVPTRVALVGLLGLILLAAPSASEAWAFAWGPRVLGPERRAFSRALAELPPHRLLVVPPEIFPRPEGIPWAGDPLEVRYPWGEYRSVEAQRRQPGAQLVSLGDYLSRPEDFTGQETLLYLGAGLRSFAPVEKDAGLVRPPYARPSLCALLRTHTLEPVATFELSTRNHPKALLRLTGDALPVATLGFFRLRARATSRDPDSGMAP
ncbi:MAG: hypothetical protein GXP55_20090 [Deltaproteobacteria bacterium]|nr:hypothetical protein [Deltaproteobacteria bacterium]